MCDEELALLRKIHRMTQSQLSDEENALLATLIGAIGAFLLRRCRWLIPLPTVIANVLIVPPILKYAYGVPYAIGTHSALPFFMLTVGIGEVVCAYILGRTIGDYPSPCK